MLADEFPEMGIVSPQTLGLTYMALHLMVDDVDRVWQRALDAGAEVFRPLEDSFWGERQAVGATARRRFRDPYRDRRSEGA